MILSHSKLSYLLNCPMSYYLKYVVGIQPRDEKPAFAMGSAVHWGIEHNTEDLTEYYKDQFKTRDNFTRDQLLAEAMCHGYFKHKQELFDKILTDENGEKLTLIEEWHEVRIEAPLKSNCGYEHTFVGIIDLLLLTNKGFIIIDYKTSSAQPDFNKYLEQCYKYIFLCNHEFPDTPVIKIGIINLQKTKIRQKQNESNDQFLHRLFLEYDLNEEDYINYNEFHSSVINKEFMQDYFENMSRMADFAELIERNGAYFINYGNASNVYGKGDFYDIFYHTPDAYVLYKIKDKWIDEEGNECEFRPCRPIDMLAIENKPLLNKYDKFLIEYQWWISQGQYKWSSFIEYLDHSPYVYDIELLKSYCKMAGILTLKIEENF